ncbi:beta-phosphoglucomutase [Bacillaceae bacterium S4-13-58]
MRSIEAVIFDLDGVITDTAEYHYLAWKQLAEELGVSFDRETNESLKGIGRMESLELILQKGNIQMSQEKKEELATKKNDHYKTFIQKISPDDLLPGILSFLQELKREGIKTGLASASKNAHTVIEQLEVGSYLDTIVDAATVKQGKPNPEVFLRAAEQLGVNADNCVGVEDAEAGVQAIKSANMYAVGVGSATSLHQADWIIDTTEKLTLTELRKHALKD